MISIKKNIGAVVASAALVLFWCHLSTRPQKRAVNDIIRSLAPIKGQVESEGYGGKRKKERVEDDDIILDYRYSTSLEVYFPFDSAKITKRARRQLDFLGRALTSKQLKRYRYLIAGHTDAKGSNAYNLNLSIRRAFAVKKYLFRTFPLPALAVTGRWLGEEPPEGSRAPLCGDQPTRSGHPDSIAACQ